MLATRYRVTAIPDKIIINARILLNPMGSDRMNAPQKKATTGIR
jgi:hypothetical protein